MADPWKIAQHLEEHPDDHEQRWRLAKKLYAAWEYRHALEHLQILKNEWTRHINVNRYLAATLYRLGRYEEAIKELREALRHWPGEVPLHEQLARVLEVSGSREEAAKVWDRILELDPAHATAKGTAERLRAQDAGNDAANIPMLDSDSGLHLSRGLHCKNCGAQNGQEFDRCWQCHAPLGQQSGSMPTPFPTMPPVQAPVPREHVNLLAGFVTVAVFTLAVYASMRLLSDAHTATGNLAQLPLTLHTLYVVDLAQTRVVMGLVLVVLWPSLLVFCVRLVRPAESAPTGWIALCGLFVASCCYLLTWLAGSMVWLVLPAAAFLPLALMLLTFKMRLGPVFAAWAVHLVLLGVLAPLCFGLLEAKAVGALHNPFAATATLLAVGATPGDARPSKTVLVQSETLPASVEAVWGPRSSPWLTQRARRVIFVIDYGPMDTNEPTKFEVKDHTGTLVFTEVGGPGTRIAFNVMPETRYIVLLTGAGNVRATVEVESLLPLEHTPTE